jgi:hypothetical protein
MYRHEISARRSPPDRLQFHRVSLGYLQPFRRHPSCAFRLWVAALVNPTRTGPKPSVDHIGRTGRDIDTKFCTRVARLGAHES